MLNVHDQCISLNKLIFSASLDSGFFSNAIISNNGISPRTENKIIPGKRKLSKGEFFNSDKGNPINSPVGEIINTPPPPIAPDARIPNTIKKIFLMFTECALSLVGIRLLFNLLARHFLSALKQGQALNSIIYKMKGNLRLNNGQVKDSIIFWINLESFLSCSLPK